MARTLVVIRHAKAVDPDGIPDSERPLTERGLLDARAAGRVLAAAPAPDLVLVSPAVRTRQTWEEAERELTSPGTVCYEPALYQAGPRAVLGLVRATAEEVACLVVVGHNPSMQELALALAGTGKGVAQMREKFPTCAIAVLSLPGSWRDLADGGARLKSFTVARG